MPIAIPSVGSHAGKLASTFPDLDRVETLDSLNEIFDQCSRCHKASNQLRHVYGGGATRNPKYCFVLINPTHLNISTRPEYSGPRFPFIGVRQFWRILHRAGFLGDDVMSAIEGKEWTRSTTRKLLQELRRRSIYVTNLVKCAQPHPDLPPAAVIRQDFPLLCKEISLVRPQAIVSFGQLPFRVLTGESIRLYEYYESLTSGHELRVAWFHTPDGMRFPVFPTFFPTGRGNPRLAVEILRFLAAEQSRASARVEQMTLSCA